MKGFDKLNVKSAVKTHSKMDLSRTHLTTAQFGQIIPLFCEETVPGDKFNVSANYFSRMAPLVKPTYGKFSFHTMTSFVPYIEVADDVEAWLAGKSTWEGITPSSRWITMLEYAKFLTNAAVSDYLGSGVTSGQSYDFVCMDASGNDGYYALTEKGKYWVKILNALGYAIPQGMSLKTGNAWYTSVGAKKLSALPILAFAKAYNDYMSQSTRYNTKPLTHLLRCIKHNSTATGYNTTTCCLLYNGLLDIMAGISVCYETDYFLSAWQKPNAPINSVDSLAAITAPYSDGAGSTASIYNTVNDTDLQISYNKVTQRALDWLKSFDDWVRRNNYSGSRAVQQVYSRFGIKTDDFRSNYAHIIDTDVMPIQVGDVTAQGNSQITVGGDTVTAGLGDYAGKGILSGNKGFNFEASDYGMLFVFGWFTVAPMNAYGFDKRVLRSEPLDYYNPEFDGLGAEAISYGEVFDNPRVTQSDDPSLDTSVYGFTERYNSYRFGRDVITGEFRNFDYNSDMNVWHTGRLLNDERETGVMVAQSTAMVLQNAYNSQFNRIFSNIDGTNDKFYLTAQFSVSAVRPMLSLNQVPNLGEGNTSVPRNGNVVD